MNTNRLLLVLGLIGLILFSGIGCGKNKAIENPVKFKQYMVQGMRLYRQHCANCHQTDGTGLAKLVPPLKDADYLNILKSDEFACQIKYGLEGEIEVNGILFNQPMPAISHLTSIEIAEIVTYVNNTWGRGREDGIYEVKIAEKALNNCFEER